MTKVKILKLRFIFVFLDEERRNINEYVKKM